MVVVDEGVNRVDREEEAKDLEEEMEEEEKGVAVDLEVVCRHTNIQDKVLPHYFYHIRIYYQS